MVNKHTEIKAALETILPTYYEMTLHKGIKTPCISYLELSNVVISTPFNVGKTQDYSRITYQIKVWGTNIAEIQAAAEKIDKVLSDLGYTRTSCGEMYDNNSSMIQKIMSYETLVNEIK